MPDNIMTMEAPAVFRNRSPEIKDLASALVKAQAELSGAKKGSKAVITGNQSRTYADLASVWEAIREPLTDNGLCIVQFPRTSGQGVEIETTLMHGATGQFMSDVLWVPCGKNDAQGLGSAITYGRRYALMAVVGVCPVDDDGAAAVASHKAGAAGTAGGGSDFRPDGPRRQSSWGEGGKAAVIDDAKKDGLTANAKPKPLPGAAAQINTPEAAGNAVKRLEWVKASREYLSDKDEHVARDWWIENKARIDVIETALPKAFDELLDTYNQALDRKVTA